MTTVPSFKNKHIFMLKLIGQNMKITISYIKNYLIFNKLRPFNLNIVLAITSQRTWSKLTVG